MNLPHHTAILLFANSAKKELQQKHIPHGEKLFDALTQSTLNKAQKTGLPVFHISEKEQIGTSFGERFTNAIQSVLNKGYQHLIVVGNDTPQLTTKHLFKTKEQLSKGKTVFGPSTDGGFYLMGISKEHFNTAEFNQLPWQQASLYKKVREWVLKKELQNYTLPILHDIDSLENLKKIVHSFKTISSKLFRLICALIEKVQISIHYFKSHIDLLLFRMLYNKGSPTLLLI